MHESPGRRTPDADDDDPSQPSRTPRPLPGSIALAAAAGLIALVAFASRSAVAPTGDLPFDLKPGFTLVRAIAYLGMALGTLALPFVIVMRARARQARAARNARSERQLEPVPWWARAIGIGVLAGMFVFQIAVVLAFIDDLRRHAGAAGGGAGGAGGVLDPSGLVQGSDDLTALSIALVLVLALGVLIVVMAVRWRVLDGPATVAVGDHAAIARAVDLSLDALRREPDPRRAVIAAYAAMERSLSAAGFARLRHEAPLEYLRRVISGPTVVGEDVRTITLLFQYAKFSHHPVEEGMRGQAIDALGNIRSAIGGAA
ncbi:MAG TPA: DUF4129 domain-containing protein [Candidatus Dormibacteraeota bacterium]|nr:DUF4129 domain-containing protein [Candidatus Dormibacteraeota bacterium]